MASGNQLKALLESHLSGDDDRFYSVAIQVAAHEARLGHGKLAVEIRTLIDKAKSRRGLPQPVPISRPKGELGSLLTVGYPKTRLSDLVLDQHLVEQIRRVILEQRHAERILEHGLTPRRKLLLVGPPGTGKTLTASVLAGELGLPLLEVRLDSLITRYMGETATKLRQVFDATSETRGVYLFDEFDAIGSQRGLGNDVGEIRRILNSFLLMIEQDRSHSLVVAATNHPEILDPALFRRFDDVLHYEIPDEVQAVHLLRSRLGRWIEGDADWQSLGGVALGLSHAEITRASEEVLKDRLIRGQSQATEQDARKTLEERRGIAKRLSQAE
ncbi:MAG: ATP-binding protein [Thermoanaerobaculia bacterium]|nr:ATP-binding protein [Thermoanaerobaculia bacterium]